MARKFTQMWTSVWDDPDFVALTCAQQTVYWAHANNQDISWCGVLPLLPQRLVDCASDLTESKARAATTVLEKRRFLILDRRTAEVFVRRFVHYNEAMKIPNVAKAVGRAFYLVRSTALRDAILVELARELGEFPDWPGWGALHAAYPELWDLVAANSSGKGSPNPSGKGSGKGSGNPSPNPSSNSSGKGSPNTPQPTTHNPQPSPLKEEEPPLASLGDPQDDEPAPKPKRGSRLDPDFVPSETSRATILAEHPTIDLRDQHARFVDYWTAKPGKDGVKLDWDATWRNWMRKAGEDHPRRTPNSRQQQVDDQYARSIARAEARQAAAASQGELE